MKYPIHDATALLQSGKFTDGNPLAVPVVPPSPDRAVYMNMVFDELLAVLAAGGVTPDYALTNQVQAAIAFQITAAVNQASLIRNTHQAIKRQTVLSGPDSSGAAAFLQSIGTNGLELVAGVAATPLRVSFADGFDAYGERNLVFSIDDNADLDPWTLTTDSQINYLFVEADAFSPAATFTTGSSTLAPHYGITPPAAPASGQYWFSTSQYKGFLYNGSSWVGVLRVYVGQSQSNGSTVSNIISYAYLGKASIVSAATVSLDQGVSWTVACPHKLGINTECLLSNIKYKVATIISGTSQPIVNEVFESLFSNNGGGGGQQGAISIWHGRTQSSVIRHSTLFDQVFLAASTSDLATITAYVVADFWRSF